MRLLDAAPLIPHLSFLIFKIFPLFFFLYSILEVSLFSFFNFLESIYIYGQKFEMGFFKSMERLTYRLFSIKSNLMYQRKKEKGQEMSSSPTKSKLPTVIIYGGDHFGQAI